MSGDAVALKARFLSRNGDQISVNDAVPIASTISFNQSASLFSGAFELSMEFHSDEKFPVSSHDFIEFYFDDPVNGPYQVGVGFLEDTLTENPPDRFSIKANGRELIGQLLNLSYQKYLAFNGSIDELARISLQGTYLKNYLEFRNVDASILDLGAFPGKLLGQVDNQRKRAPILQEYAGLAMNLVFQNRFGQLVIYGRKGESGEVKGTLIKAPAKSNVVDIAVRQNFSKIISEIYILYADEEKNVSLDSLVNISSRYFKNTDPRVSGKVYQPQIETFASSDLTALSGDVPIGARIDQLSKSKIRQSNQNLNLSIVTMAEPFVTDENGKRTYFELLQTWRVVDASQNLDAEMVLSTINYAQRADGLNVQLGFVEKDTLV